MIFRNFVNFICFRATLDFVQPHREDERHWRAEENEDPLHEQQPCQGLG